ncbi:MAG TPA: glycosyltransferase family 4 protein [Chitinophagales bacterium]|nr:glycosyltransferase family 4 protein [Chitinophagales bacterium]
MKIAFILPQNIIGGGQISVYEHGRRLQSSGHDVVIIYREYVKGRDEIWFPQFGLKHLAWDDIDLKTTRYDVMIATWWETLYDIFLFNADYYFYFTQDDERRFYEDPNSYKIRFCDLTYKLPDIGIITVPKWWKNVLHKEGNKHIGLAPSGFHETVFNPAKRKPNPNGKLRVLIEGPGEVWFRRVADSFKAVEGLEGIEVWFKARGNYVDPSWKYDKIFFNCTTEELADLYAQCDVLLKMSEVEAFCLPNVEMMACGGTIITTNFTGHEEYSIPDVNSFVIPIRDTDAARNAVIKLRDDRALLARMQAEAYNTARDMTWTIQTQKFEKALLELVEIYKGHDYSHTRQLMNALLDMKIAIEITEKSKQKLERDYNYLFAQHHRKEYSLFRYIGRIVYRIPVVGPLLRKIFSK